MPLQKAVNWSFVININVSVWPTVAIFVFKLFCVMNMEHVKILYTKYTFPTPFNILCILKFYQVILQFVPIS